MPGIDPLLLKVPDTTQFSANVPGIQYGTCSLPSNASTEIPSTFLARKDAISNSKASLSDASVFLVVGFAILAILNPRHLLEAELLAHLH